MRATYESKPLVAVGSEVSRRVKMEQQAQGTGEASKGDGRGVTGWRRQGWSGKASRAVTRECEDAGVE